MPAPPRRRPVIKRILVPLDFSGKSRQALRFAVPLAEGNAATIVLLHVLEHPASTADSMLPALDTRTQMRQAMIRLQQSADALLPPRMLARVAVRTGVPFDEITQAARELNVDLIVLSTHGYCGLKRAFTGSTAERVVRHAPCPVLTVRRG